MKIRKTGKSVLSLILAVVLAFSVMPVSAQAKSSSEIREQIKDMKAENKELEEELKELKKKITEHFDETTICHTQNGMTAYLNKTEKELLLKQIFSTIDLTAQVMSEYPRPRHRKMPTKK